MQTTRKPVRVFLPSGRCTQSPFNESLVFDEHKWCKGGRTDHQGIPGTLRGGKKRKEHFFLNWPQRRCFSIHFILSYYFCLLRKSCAPATARGIKRFCRHFSPIKRIRKERKKNYLVTGINAEYSTKQTNSLVLSFFFFKKEFKEKKNKVTTHLVGGGFRCLVAITINAVGWFQSRDFGLKRLKESIILGLRVIIHVLKLFKLSPLRFLKFTCGSTRTQWFPESTKTQNKKRRGFP